MRRRHQESDGTVPDAEGPTRGVGAGGEEGLQAPRSSGASFLSLEISFTPSIAVIRLAKVVPFLRSRLEILEFFFG